MTVTRPRQATVQVRLLGGFQVVLPDGRVAGPWVRPTARRVFELLVVSDQHRMGREELVEVLFPNVAPDRASGSLSKALSMARAALAPFEVIAADRDVVWLAGAIEVDAEEQRSALRQAMALPPGDARDAALVAGLEERGRLLDQELYADWARHPRHELEGLRESARLALARDRGAGHGRASSWDAQDAWREVLVHDPTNEEACGATMRAAAAAGMRDMVVRTNYRTVAALDDLDLEPSEALQAVYAQAVRDADQAPAAQEAPPSSIRTFGRDAALAALRELVAPGRRESSTAILISGPAGIGKTHLLGALGRELHAAGWQVVQATAAAEDRRAPLRALRSVLGQLDLAKAGPIVRLVAEGEGSADAVERSAVVRRQLVGELLALLDGAAIARPLAVMIDDLQWTDEALQAIVGELVERRSHRRWIIVLASRNDEAGTAVMLPASVTQLPLVPLAADGVELLVRQTAPELDKDAVAACVARSGGNPFFAMELARHHGRGTAAPPAVPDVPPLIIGLLDTRLARCSPAARRLLSLLALLGGESTVETLLAFGAEPGARGGEATIRTVDELASAHLIDERPTGVRLVHPLLRDAAVARLNPARRSTLHRVIASSSAGEVAARHYLAAFEASALCEHARDAAGAGFAAGHQARRLFADQAAAELFGGGLRAFDAAGANDREALRSAAFEAWRQVGDIHLQRDARAEAERAYEAAMALAVSDEERERAWSAIAGLAYRVGDFQTCVASYERGIASLGEASPEVRARLEADLGWTYFRLGRIDESVAVLERATATLGELGDPWLRGHALDRLATVLGVAGRAEEGLAVMQRAFAALGPTGDERELGILHIHRATLFSVLGRFGEALADAAAALRVGTASSDHYSLAVTHWVTGAIHERRGDFAAALAERQSELVVLEQTGNVRNTVMAHAACSRLFGALGRGDESAGAAVAARQGAQAQGDPGLSDAVEQRLLTMGATG